MWLDDTTPDFDTSKPADVIDTDEQLFRCFHEAMTTASLFTSVLKMKRLIHEYATYGDLKAVHDALKYAVIDGHRDVYRTYSYAQRCTNVHMFRSAIRRRSGPIGETLLLRLLERYSGISAVVIGKKDLLHQGDPILSDLDRHHLQRMNGSKKYVVLLRDDGGVGDKVSYTLYKDDKGKSVFLWDKGTKMQQF